MTTALSVDSFVELIERSGLLSGDQVQQVLRQLEADGTQVDTPEALADALVRRELLTSWQAGFLLKGKHSGFFLGSYRFLRMLGKGGMGAVYLAEHQMMRRRCAIKVLPTKLISESSSVLERFYLEAQAVAALDDPNIVRAYDVNKQMQGTREIHYLVMEYVDGCDLQVLVQRKGPLDYVQVADFARQAASGLAHAHECGLIHRDIKPANLLVDERGIVKILDLGLARFFDDRLDASLTTTHNESILGTADYLSPEQALDSHNVDTRTDIYSLGCTCYYLLTGHPPFPEGSVAQRLMSHQTKSPTAIEKIRRDAPTDLVTIVEKMLAKSPDNRYQSAREVGDAFTAWLAKHAGEDWKKEHRDIVDGSTSRAQPTRAKSAATEETDLELGLAPTEELGLAPTEELGLAPTKEEKISPSQVRAESPAAKVDTPSGDRGEGELGLDQLEELEPLTNTFDPGLSSGGLDNLLNEALDNYPTLDSNPNLAGLAGNPAMGSGHYGAVKPAPGKPAPGMTIESKQLLKLILIGFAVSVPLSIVILVVSSQSSAPDPPRASVASAVVPAEPGQVSQRGEESVSEKSSPATPPVTPATENAKPNRPENSQPPKATNAIEVPTTPEVQPTLAPAPVSPNPAETQAAPTTPPTAAPTAQPATNPATTPEADPDPSSVAPQPPNTTPPNKAPPEGTGASSDEPSVTHKPEPAPPSAERVKELFAGLSEVFVTLDRKTTQQSFTYDAMVIREAIGALEQAGLKGTAEPQNTTPAAVMTLSFTTNKADQYVVFSLGAELKCRDGDAQEVSLWKHQAEVGRMKTFSATPPSPLRKEVSVFFNAFGKEHSRARKE
ncbi:MAG: protein kinase [Planctomycetota bacterium]